MDELRPHLCRSNPSLRAVRFLVSRGPGAIFWSPFYLARTLFCIVYFRLTGRADVLHVNLSSHGSTYRKLMVTLLARILGIPYILHLHGSGFHQFWDGASTLLSRAISMMFENGALTIVLGTFWKNYVTARVPSARLVVMPTPTSDPQAIGGRRSDKSSINILFAGQLGPRKGVPELIAALGRLSSSLTWHAVLTGDGDVIGTRRSLADLGIADRVLVPGWISAKELDEEFDRADILVLPSHQENLPLSVVEAFARGMAVVCTNVGALPDIAHDNVTALVVSPGDVNGLTAALLRLLNDGRLRTELGNNARKLYEEQLELSTYVNQLAASWCQIAMHPDGRCSVPV